jgi:hypothetical protein
MEEEAIDEESGNEENGEDDDDLEVVQQKITKKATAKVK